MLGSSPMPGRLLFVLLLIVLSGCGAVALPARTAVSVLPTPTPSATPAPETPLPTPAGTPPPTPVPEGGIALDVIGCEGGAVLEWTVSAEADFHHYIAMRSPERVIAPEYPPVAPAVDWGDTYATDRFVTSAVDATIVATERDWHYRVMAYDLDGDVVGASNVATARHRPVVELGALTARAIADLTRLEWSGYEGDPRCFSSYQVLYGTDGVPDSVLRVVTDQAITWLATSQLQSGTSYSLRVEAIRATALGTFVAARTDVTTYVPR